MLRRATCVPHQQASSHAQLIIRCVPSLNRQELPAANLNALWLLLETCNRVAAEAATNEMDARALSAALAPVLAWHPPPPKTLSQVRACHSLLMLGICHSLCWSSACSLQLQDRMSMS